MLPNNQQNNQPPQSRQQSINSSQRQSNNQLNNHPSNTWNQNLQKIIQQIQNTNQRYNIFNHEFWKSILTKGNKYVLSSEQKQEFLQLILNFLKNSKIVDNDQRQKEICQSFGKKFRTFQNTLQFKHKQLQQYLNFIGYNNNELEQDNNFSFSNLKFDLSIEQTLKVAQKVKNLCQRDINAFCFLSLYFSTSILKKLQNQSFQQIEIQYKNLLQLLQKQYPASQKQSSIQIQLPNIRLSEQPYQMEKISFNNNFSTKFDQLRNFIIKKANDAKNDQKSFLQLVEKICYKNGYGFKSCLKIKDSEDQDSILRTIEKLVENELNQSINYNFDTLINVNQSRQFNILKQNFDKRFFISQGSQIQIFEQLNFRIKKEKDYFKQIINRILQKKKEIIFNIKDLIRGKCNFSSLEQIFDTAYDLWEHISKQNYRVIDQKDRLDHNTKDYVLIIKLRKSIAQLQLVLLQDPITNEFNHRIYELKRSKLYTLIANLFIHNKKWSNYFFTKQIDHFQECLKQQKIVQFDGKLKLEDFKSGVDNFKQLFLQPIQIQCKKNSKSQQQKQNKKVQLKVNQVIEVVKQLQFITNLKDRLKSQQINEIIFLKSSLDYQNALQLLEKMTPQFRQQKELLILKADILKSKGNLDQSLVVYQKCLVLYKQQNKQSIQLSNILINIGQVYEGKQDYNNALEHYKSCLQIRTSNGNDSIDVANTLNKIALMNYKLKNNLEALDQYKKCLKIRQKIKGNESIDVARTRSDIGLVYYSSQNYKQALQQFEQSLRLKIKIKGYYSIEVVETLDYIGLIYNKMGDHEKSLLYYQRSLEVQTKIMGNNSIHIANTFKSMSITYESKGQYNKSWDCAQNCYQIHKKLFGEDNEMTKDSQLRLKELKNRVKYKIQK